MTDRSAPTDNERRDGPVLIEIDAPGAETPATAPPVPDPDPVLPEPRAMQLAATLAARKPSRLARWFWGLAGALVSFLASVAAWQFVTGLLASQPLLGLIATALILAFVAVLLVIALRELAAFARLRRVDTLHAASEEAAARDDLPAAREVVTKLKRLYRDRDEMRVVADQPAQGVPRREVAGQEGMDEHGPVHGAGLLVFRPPLEVGAAAQGAEPVGRIRHGRRRGQDRHQQGRPGDVRR